MNVAMPLLCTIVVLPGFLALPYLLLFLHLFACSLLCNNLFVFPHSTAEARVQSQVNVR